MIKFNQNFTHKPFGDSDEDGWLITRVLRSEDHILEFMYSHDNRLVEEIRVRVILDHSDDTVLLLLKITDVGAMIGGESPTQGQYSEPSGGPTGTAEIMPRGRDGWHRTGPLAVVRCRAKYSGDGRTRLGPPGPTRQGILSIVRHT